MPPRVSVPVPDLDKEPVPVMAPPQVGEASSAPTVTVPEALRVPEVKEVSWSELKLCTSREPPARLTSPLKVGLSPTSHEPPELRLRVWPAELE